MRAFRWAAKKGYIDRDPIADYEKARPGKRNVVIPRRGPSSRRCAVLRWMPGIRRSSDLHLGDSCTTPGVPDRRSSPCGLSEFPHGLPARRSKRRAMASHLLPHREGLGDHPATRSEVPYRPPVFRNSEGQPWTTDAVNCGFSRLQIQDGDETPRSETGPHARGSGREERDCIPRAAAEAFLKLAKQHAPKYCLYTLRHSWATHALAKGIDAAPPWQSCSVTGDPSTLAKVYQHLSQSPEYLREQARRAGA